MIALLLIALLAFNDGFKCEVRGDLYVMPGDKPDLMRTDGCQVLIHHRIEDGALHLWSDSHWVSIILPPDVRGHAAFAYRWGSSRAVIHGQEWLRVASGPTGGG